ncbi:MAG: transglycosylase family protein [Acidimicrobiales bacterium]
MRTHRTMALAATLSIAAGAAVTDLPSAHADLAARFRSADVRPSATALAALRSCESGGDYTTDTGNGYYGAYQFALASWQGLGYGGYPSEAPAAIQDEAVVRLYATSGWSAWPGCAASLDLAALATTSGPTISGPTKFRPTKSAAAAAGGAPSTIAAVAGDEPGPPPPPPEEHPRPRHFQDVVAEFG